MDDQGDTARCDRNVYVIRDEPVVEAGPDTSVMAGDPIVLSGFAKVRFGSILFFDWDFDGNGEQDMRTDTGRAVHVYQEPGTYQLILTAYNSDSLSGYDVAQIQVKHRHHRVMRFGDTAVAAGDLVGFNPMVKAAKGSFKMYAWDLDGDGTYETTTQTPHVKHRFHKSAQVSLHARAADGHDARMTITVLVCPGDMVPVLEAKACVDSFEYPNQRGQMPQTGMTWARAQAACYTQGKRLCTNKEWQQACSHNGKFAQPYGHLYDEKTCNTSTTGAAPSGSHLKCTTKSIIFDMAGNVWEWVGNSQSSSAVSGGAWKSGARSGCFEVQPKPAGLRAADIGFRCCK